MKWVWLVTLALVPWRWPTRCLAGRLPRSHSEAAPPLPAPGRHSSGNAATVAAALGAAGSLVLIGLPLGLFVAPVVGIVVRIAIPRFSTREQQRNRLALARGLPPSIDLLAAVLRAGMTDAAALGLVCGAAEGPMAVHLSRVARALRLGAEPEEAWRSAMAEPILAPLAEGMVRSSRTGAAVGPLLDRIAEDARARYFDEAQTAARAISVRAVLPLGLCYLPSFLLLSVVPVVAAFVSGLRW